MVSRTKKEKEEGTWIISPFFFFFFFLSLKDGFGRKQ
jgi:hypothetical protein